MKIITKGVLPEDREDNYSGICINCGCHVNFSSKEANAGPGPVSIKCPTTGCSHNIVGRNIDAFTQLGKDLLERYKSATNYFTYDPGPLDPRYLERPLPGNPFIRTEPYRGPLPQPWCSSEPIAKDL